MDESIFLTKAELKTNMYDETLAMITRADDDIIHEGIHAAIDMAKGYLSKYDLVALFGIEPATAPTISSPALKKSVKDMAIFNIAALSHANYDMAVLNQLNDNALKWLKDIQKGIPVPAGWTHRDTTNDSFNNGNQVSGFYNEKKVNRI